MEAEKTRLVFFSKGDNKFISEIIQKLGDQFEIRLITISSAAEYRLMEQWMEWAEVCWFEWCDELIAYGSKLELAEKRKILCRLHSYEAFSNYPSKVNWNRVDKLVFVSEDIRKYVIEHFKIRKDITAVIPNGVDMEKTNYSQKKPGFNVAYVGYINFKKGPMLLLHTFKAIFDADNRYRFYIAGSYQEPRYYLYFNQMLKEFGMENNLFFQGWQANIDSWLENKDYIICSSVLESQNMSVMQAMAKGIKPVIHNFVGARSIYPEKYIWNTIGQAVNMVTESNYSSEEYRSFIQQNYSFDQQILKIRNMLAGVTANPKNAT
ncbi:glycosyl transferases group 1 [Ruminiclostridium hungatei]|uniref:Glycosyl transferases group 1 n=1 Tax=Ruminiclostridium hungatei TaxID=48256 RepID=A0A1V4SIP7_RUMHU|nr:glycosyltransferase [Ruminiclostridium hungatei]OPX43748.1 glycosyl transferases group 1 [Ruminiclostridium hungatei]